MDSRLLAKVLLRLLAVYLIVRGIMFLPDVYVVRSAAVSFTQIHSNDVNPYLWYVIALFAPIIAGIILWAISPFIASRIVGSDNKQLKVSMVPGDGIPEMIIAIAGLIIVILAIPEVVNWLIQLFTRSTIIGLHRNFDMNELALLIASVLQLLLGLWLFLGARFWGHLLRSVREFGLSKSQ